MDLLGDTTRDDAPPRDDGPDLGFEGRRAFAAITNRLTGKDVSLQVGRYRVLEPLGQGGFATVYAGYDPKLDRRVAIKILRGSGSSHDTTAQERMAREAQALAQLRHPNVVQVFDVGFHGEPNRPRSVHIVMELLLGDTLGDWRKRDKPALPAILDAYQQAGRGLAAAHAVGVVHRDFKPSNAMFAASGRVKVLDFGLATVDGVVSQNTELSSGAASIRQPVSLTQTGVVMGTPRYMAPEQHRARPITERSDQYAWCVALWEALVGRPPFGGMTIAELAAEKAAGPPPRPPEIPRRIFEAIARGLNPDPERRFASMDALLAAVRAPQRRYWLAGGTVVAVAMVGVLAAASVSPPAPALCTTEFVPWTDRFAEIVTHMSPPRASRQWGVQERIRLRLERFERQWAQSRNEVCAPPIAHDAEAIATVACLQRGREQLDALVTSVLSSDVPPPESTSREMLRQAVPERCLSGEAPRLYQTDPAREQQVNAFADIADAWFEHENVVDVQTLTRVSAEADVLDDYWLSSRMALGRSMQNFRRGDSAGAAAALREAIYSAESHSDPLLAVELMPAAISHRMDAGARPDEVDPLLERTVELLEAAGQPPAPRVIYLAVAATAEGRRGDHDRSATLAMRAIEEAGDPPIAGTERTLAMALMTAYGVQMSVLPPEEIEAGVRRALAMGSPQDVSFSMTAAHGHTLLARVAVQVGDIDTALAEHLETARVLSTVTPGPNAAMVYALAIYGRLLSFRGSDALGTAYLRQGYDWIRDSVGPLDMKLEVIASLLVDANLERGNPDEALVWARRQLEHAQRQHGEAHPETSMSRFEATRALVELGRLDEAEAELRLAVEVTVHNERDYPAWQATAELRLAQGRYAEARDAVLLALADMQPTDRSLYDNAYRGELQAVLAGALRGLGEPEQAELALRAAAASMQQSSDWHRKRARVLLESLGE